MAIAMKTDGEALLVAILDDPCDDALRLIYADWLDEDGQPERARYIREQILSDPEGCRPRLHHYAQRIWPDSITSLVGKKGEYPDGWDWQWRRGFVESVRCPLDSWLEHGPQIVRAHPVTKVESTDKTPGVAKTSGGAANVSEWPHGWWPAERGILSTITLPVGLWNRLPTGYAAFAAGEICKIYSSRKTACNALSIACLAWAKLPEVERCV